jgi:hypothetical protein
MKKTSQFQSKFPENALLKLAKGNLFKCDFLEKKLSHKLKADTIKILT